LGTHHALLGSHFGLDSRREDWRCTVREERVKERLSFTGRKKKRAEGETAKIDA
jgi:hypothetical protein